MQHGNTEYTLATERAFHLRGGERIDLAPVVIVDDLRYGASPSVRGWWLGGALAGVAAQWSYLCIGNGAPAGSGIRLTVDAVRYVAGVSGSMMASILRYASINLNPLAGGAHAVESDEGADDPFAPYVGWIAQVSNNLLGNFEADPKGAVGQSDMMILPVILRPQTALVLRYSVQNASLDFAARGRFYDAA